MDTISNGYQKEQRDLHEGPYGSSGHYWLGHVLELCDIFDCKSVLDYGAGKGTLRPYLERYGIDYTPYDPATFPKKPKGQYDLTVCLDVLEHIEPDRVEAVMSEIHSHTAKVFFAVVSTRPSSKDLKDGRNAHLIQQPYEWWRDNHFSKGWKGGRTRQREGEFEVTFIRAPSPNGVRILRDQINKLRGR